MLDINRTYENRISVFKHFAINNFEIFTSAKVAAFPLRKLNSCFRINWSELNSNYFVIVCTSTHFTNIIILTSKSISVVIFLFVIIFLYYYYLFFIIILFLSLSASSHFINILNTSLRIMELTTEYKIYQ